MLRYLAPPQQQLVASSVYRHDGVRHIVGLFIALIAANTKEVRYDHLFTQFLYFVTLIVAVGDLHGIYKTIGLWNPRFADRAGQLRVPGTNDLYPQSLLSSAIALVVLVTGGMFVSSRFEPPPSPASDLCGDCVCMKRTSTSRQECSCRSRTSRAGHPSSAAHSGGSRASFRSGLVGQAMLEPDVAGDDDDDDDDDDEGVLGGSGRSTRSRSRSEPGRHRSLSEPGRLAVLSRC
jgi:hypothetical protein